MSDPRAKAERSAAKDARQGIADQRGVMPRVKRAKKERPWRVMAPSLFSTGGRPWMIHACATRDQALAWIAKESRSMAGGSPTRWIEGPDGYDSRRLQSLTHSCDNHTQAVVRG